MKVRDIMTSDPRTATADTTLIEIATMMKEEDVGVIPIIDDDRIAGMVSDRDIVLRCVAAGKDASDCTAEDVMSTDVKTIDHDSDIEAAAGTMAAAQIRRLAVVKNGKLVGMLSLGDIAVNAGEAEEETTAETLGDVSRGVKGQGRERQSGRMQQSSGGRGSQQPSARGRKQNDDRRNDARPQGRSDSGDRREREEKNAKREQKQQQKQKKAAQGVANRNLSREKQHESKASMKSGVRIAPRHAEAGRRNASSGRRRA